MKNRKWINHSMKEWGSAHDETPKTRIQNILRESGVNDVLFDETIFVDKMTFDWSNIHPRGDKETILSKYYIFKPDILSKTKNLIIELDGKFHFTTKKGVKQTNKRNEIYEYMGVNFVWFYTDELKDMSDEDIKNNLTVPLI